MPPICRCDISFFLLLPYRRKRPKKVQEPNAKIPAQIALVTYYLPTLALSKSGSGLKHPLTLSPPARAPRFYYPYHFCNGLFYNSFIIHACFQNASFLFCAFLKLSQIQLHSHIRYFAVSQLIFNIPTKSVVPLQ